MAQVIGFIGLGIMGRPMAKNLLKAGHSLIVHSRSRGPIDELVGAGASAGVSPRDGAAQSDVLIPILSRSPVADPGALGPLGFGGFTKRANQIIVAGNLTALAEALTLAKKAGLDRELTLTALAGGLAGSKCLEQKKPNYVGNTYIPGFKIDLHYKDLGLIAESARELGIPLPMTAVVQELFNALRVKGRGGLDHSGVITLLEDLAGV